MATLAGLPDFGAELSSEQASAFAPFAAGSFGVLPQAGALADLKLTMTRYAGASGGYGMLDVEVGCAWPLDDALELVRGGAPGATVAALPIELGFARMVPAGGDIALPPAMTEPVSLGWSGADGARWTQRLDLDTAELIKGAVAGASLLFGVRIEFTVDGVAPRAPAQVSFVPAALFTQALDPAKGRFIAREDLVIALSDASRTPALVMAAPRIGLADALADRLLAAFGAFVPAAEVEDAAGFAISAALPAERLDWDLSTPTASPRAFFLRLDTVSGLAALDPASLVSELTVPAIDLGFREVLLAANLPARRERGPGDRRAPERASGAAPTGPTGSTRPSSSRRRTTRAAPLCASIRTRPSRTTSRRSRWSRPAPYGGVRRPTAGAWRQLRPTPGGRFRPRLLPHHGQRSPGGGGERHGRADLHPERRQRLRPLRAFRRGPRYRARHAGRGDRRPLVAGGEIRRRTVASLPASPAGNIRLDLSSFPGYGPRRLAIHCDFSDGESPLGLDLEPQNGTGAATVFLAPSAPDMSWGYFAASPFEAGYRFRPQGGAWSPILDPATPLVINPVGTIESPMPVSSTPSANDTAPAPIAPFEIDGVKLAPDPAMPGVLRYLPASPTPELDPRGHRPS